MYEMKPEIEILQVELIRENVAPNLHHYVVSYKKDFARSRIGIWAQDELEALKLGMEYLKKGKQNETDRHTKPVGCVEGTEETKSHGRGLIETIDPQPQRSKQ